MSAVANHSLPYPIIVAAEREPGEIIIAENATMWEFNLGEFGTWAWGSDKKTMGAFTSIEYLGTGLDGGKPVDSNTCWSGYDNVGFVVATSASLFNVPFMVAVTMNHDNLAPLVSKALELVEGVFRPLSKAQNDVAIYVNPFRNWDTGNNPVSTGRM
jgi:lysophospholipase